MPAACPRTICLHGLQLRLYSIILWEFRFFLNYLSYFAYKCVIFSGKENGQDSGYYTIVLSTYLGGTIQT